MTDSKGLAPFIGFMENEVKQLCADYHMEFDEAQQWYDGYTFGDDLHIYNPKSIVDAMRNQRFKSYWTRTETYEALRIYIDMNFDGLKDAIISMFGMNTFCFLSSYARYPKCTNKVSTSSLLSKLVISFWNFSGFIRQLPPPTMEIMLSFSPSKFMSI